jgi:hypothetical protein
VSFEFCTAVGIAVKSLLRDVHFGVYFTALEEIWPKLNQYTANFSGGTEEYREMPHSGWLMSSERLEAEAFHV